MPQVLDPREKRKKPLQTRSWFEAIGIIDENNSEYLVRWAGKDPSGKEWAPSWVR
jgi:hypothetical protein